MLCDWSRKLALLSQPIRCKTNTNYDLVFPRLGSWVGFTWSSDWLLKYFPFSNWFFGIYPCFGFTTLNRKALYAQGIYANTTTSTEKEDYMASCDKTVIEIRKMKAFLTFAMALGLALLSKRKVATLSWL